VGFMVPSYFSDRWGQNLCGQTTIRKSGPSAMHPLETPGELGGYGTRAAGLPHAGTWAWNTFSRLRPLTSRCLSHRRKMAMLHR
jgi:hypothetical protein